MKNWEVADLPTPPNRSALFPSSLSFIGRDSLIKSLYIRYGKFSEQLLEGVGFGVNC